MRVKPEDFTAWLKRQVKLEKCSQSEFARRRGLSVPWFNLVLSGKRSPSKAFLQALGLREQTVYVESQGDQQ